MRITPSRDGKRRATLRIDVRMGRDEFIDTLALAATKGAVPGVQVLDADDVATLPERMSRTAIMDAIKSATQQFGTDARDWWRDDAEGYDDELHEWATDRVDHAFPEFHP